MGRIPLAHPWHPPSHAVQPPPRDNLFEPCLVIAFQYLHHPIAIPVPIIHSQWLPRVSAFFVLAVPTPVARHDVHPPVPVKVPHSYTVPPAAQLVDGCWLMVGGDGGVPQNQFAA